MGGTSGSRGTNVYHWTRLFFRISLYSHLNIVAWLFQPTRTKKMCSVATSTTFHFLFVLSWGPWPIHRPAYKFGACKSPNDVRTPPPPPTPPFVSEMFTIFSYLKIGPPLKGSMTYSRKTPISRLHKINILICNYNNYGAQNVSIDRSDRWPHCSLYRL